MLTRGRLTGDIPWEAIADPTRGSPEWAIHTNVKSFIEDETKSFLTNYWRDLLQSQPNHIEIIGEKNTIQGIIDPVAQKYCIRYTIARGFCSIDPRKKLVDRFEKSGKEKLVILALSDFDPSGEEISHSLTRSLRDDFDIDEDRIIPIKVALTLDQVRELQLPPRMKAKEDDANYNRFVANYGTNVYELEAVRPEELQRLLTTAIEQVIDVPMFNKEVEKEKADAAYLQSVRTIAFDYLKTIDLREQ